MPRYMGRILAVVYTKGNSIVTFLFKKSLLIHIHYYTTLNIIYMDFIFITAFFFKLILTFQSLKN